MTNDQLLDLAMKAVYAGHKYHLALQRGMDSWSQGEHDTPTNGDLISRYFTEWKRYNRQALRLHRKMQEGGA